MRERNFHFPSEYENPRIVQFQKIGWTEALDIVVNNNFYRLVPKVEWAYSITLKYI